MVNFAHFNMKHLGNILLLSFLLVVTVVVVHMVISPLLVTVFPTVFTGSLTLTDTLLFFILLRLIVK